MIEKIKSYVLRINPHSPKVIVAVFSAIFIIFILIILSVLNSENRQVSTVSPITPPPVSNFIPKSEIVEGQILVKFKDGVTDFVISQHLAKYNARIKSRISGINVTVIEVPIGQEEKTRTELSKEEIVKYAEPDHVAHGTYVPNDTNFGNQYGLNNSGQNIKGNSGKANADIHIKEAWDVTKGEGITVAVIDTGLDTAHPEFAGKVTSQKILITSSIDDGFGHGTHTAGILSADTNNNTGIAGACPECKLMIIKALDDSGNGPYSVIAQGMTYAADNGAKVISMSLGGYDIDQTLSDAVNYAWGKGVVTVAAAGNDNTNRKFYPGGYSKVVTVAATDNNDQKASFSNYGDWVSVAAPGKDIFSTLPTHSFGLQSRGFALNYDYLSGTSMATPMVSGVVAMIWTTSYGTSNQAVVDRLLSTVDPITGTGTYWQKGRINAAAAVATANPTPTPSLNPTVTATPTATLTPTVPVPTFVCGGSPNSICNPTTAVTPGPTTGTTPIITQGPNITDVPTITPTITPTPGNDCLNPRSTPEKIRDWVNGFIKKISDYIQSIMGNPQNPTRPAPPVPCIIR